MNNIEGSEKSRVAEEVKAAASRLMHLHYCDNDVEGVIASFAPVFSWFGAGEEQFAASREEAEAYFRRFRGAIPPCEISGEEYCVQELVPNVYLCSGTMWIATKPESKTFLRVHQRVTFVFERVEAGLLCSHIHCSNPYTDLVEDELFPNKVGKQTFEYVQERLRSLEEEQIQKNRQLEVVMASIRGGLKISRDDDAYSFAYVSPEAAALFGYTVEEFMEVSHGTAVGAVYPPDLPRVLAECEEAFRDGRVEYAIKYRVPCKDGSLRWILDSGKKAKDDQGATTINSIYLDITKSEQDAQKILQQGELLRSIYDTVPCGILRFTRRGGEFQMISLNRAALALLNYADAGSCAADWKNGVAGTVLPEDQSSLRASYDRLRQVGDSVNIFYRVADEKGKIRYLSGTNSVISSKDGCDVIQRIMFDVTERAVLQERLDREQEMYRVAMEASSDVMYEYREEDDTLVSYAPSSSAGAHGDVVRHEFPRYCETLRERGYVHPDDVPAVMDNICRGRAEVFEARFSTPDVPPGEDYWWYRVTGKRIGAQGRPVRVVGTFRNVNREKRTLWANKEELHMNQSALQAISGGYMSIYYADLPAGSYYAVRIPDFGDGALQSRTGDIRESIRSYAEAYLAPRDREKLLDFMDPDALCAALNQAGGRVGMEFCHQHPRKGDVWLRLEVQTISREGGRPKNAVVTFRNVTQERRMELEHQKEEEKAKRALEEAYAAARSANLAKSDFLSRMSHDIRTPMNAIVGMTAIAKEHRGEEGRLLDCLDKIQSSSALLLGLINEVLDMSKIESGNMDLVETAFGIRQIMEETAGVVRPELEQKEQELRLDCRLEHEAVKGDLVRIRQILLNLLTNAVKYTPSGGRILFSVQERPWKKGGTGCYEFLIRDNGIGMSQEFQRKQFLPFERASDPRVSRVQGTGLGMAITQNLVRMMGGQIRVESRIDEGSSFYVTLYLRRADRLEEPAEEEGERELAFCPGHRILLAEDNALNREIVRTLLEDRGFLVEEAENGEIALERFRASAPGHYELVLMDIRMPRMDGYEASRAIRALPRQDAVGVPIVALTADAFADDVTKAREAGMDLHLAKPLKVQELMGALKRFLE